MNMTQTKILTKLYMKRLLISFPSLHYDYCVPPNVRHQLKDISLTYVLLRQNIIANYHSKMPYNERYIPVSQISK